MDRIFSLNFWVSTFLSTMFTIFMIYLIKKIFANTSIPIVSDAVASV